MKRYKKLFNEEVVTWNKMNKILKKYGYELWKNAEDKLWFISTIDFEKTPSISPETLDWHIPMTNPKFDVKKIMEFVVDGIVGEIYASVGFSEVNPQEAFDLMDQIISDFKLSKNLTKKIDRYRE